MNEVSLVMAAYPKSFSRYRTSNQGTFHMVKMRQSSMSSRSMGVVSNSVEHDYYNKTSTNTSLVPLTSSLMNALGRLNEQAQDTSGQILIGQIKKGNLQSLWLERYFIRTHLSLWNNDMSTKNSTK